VETQDIEISLADGLYIIQEEDGYVVVVVVVPVVGFSVAPLPDGIVGDEVPPLYLFFAKTD
jgi:hypothetical protein